MKVKAGLHNCGHKGQSLDHAHSSQRDLISCSLALLRAVHTVCALLTLQHFVLTSLLSLHHIFFTLSVAIFFIWTILACGLPCCIIASHLAFAPGVFFNSRLLARRKRGVLLFCFCFLSHWHTHSHTHTFVAEDCL